MRIQLLFQIILVLLLTSCMGTLGNFASDEKSPDQEIDSNLLESLDENLLYTSECRTQGNISYLTYISKVDNRLLLEWDYLDNLTCDFGNDDWIQVIKKTYSFNSDSGSLVSGSKISTEYYLMPADLVQEANQAMLCNRSDWVNDQWFEVSNSSCDMTSTNSAVSFNYNVISSEMIEFDGIIFNK